MGKQTKQNLVNGYSWEYIIGKCLEDKLSDLGYKVSINKEVGYLHRKNNFEQLSSQNQVNYQADACGLIEKLLEWEKISKGQDPVLISFKDKGVTDLLVEGGDFVINLSAKQNHLALRHPRISKTIDIQTEWGMSEFPAPQYYYDTVDPIFDKLIYMIEGRAKKDRPEWTTVKDKDSSIYGPITSLLHRLLRENITSTKSIHKLFGYFTGNVDFYRLFRNSSVAKLESFNINGSLNGAQWSLPTKVETVDRQGNNVVLVQFDRGFKWSFRVHSASSKVENSLKFDVRMLEYPENYNTYTLTK